MSNSSWIATKVGIAKSYDWKVFFELSCVCYGQNYAEEYGNF